MNDDIRIIVSQLVEYNKELNDLKESGIDISKLAPHKILYNSYTQILINLFGVSMASDIEWYASDPTISLKEFLVYLDDTYFSKQNDTKECNLNEDKNLKENVVEKEPKKEEINKESSEYYVNNQKVSKESYDESVKQMHDLLDKWLKKQKFISNGFFRDPHLF